MSDQPLDEPIYVSVVEDQDWDPTEAPGWPLRPRPILRLNETIGQK